MEVYTLWWNGRS
jgi:serine/threonine protein kinase